MKKIQSGTVFVYSVSSNYGLIQVIGKSKTVGYNVRVFCDLIQDIDESNINRVISIGDYYFVRDFYEYDLIHKSVTKVFHKLPTAIAMPKYMKTSERKANGDLLWYIIDVDTGKVVKKFHSFNKELINLSPYRAWGIEYIQKRWSERFSLNQWDDNLENKWYLDYLHVYEPEANVHSNNIVTPKLLGAKKRGNKYSSTVKVIVERLLDKFIMSISAHSENVLYVNEALIQLIEGLNTANEKYCFLETQDSEKLIEYINHVLISHNCTDSDDIIDRFRQW